MRRRISTHESFRDVTAEPHHYLDEYEGTLSLLDPPLLLEDDALWSELQTAQAALRRVATR